MILFEISPSRIIIIIIITGQHTALGLALQQLPAKGAAAQSATQPFPLLYGERNNFLNF